MALEYKKSLDGVRAVAVLLVLTFHSGLTHFGWVGVQLFFVLSGYLITGILWKERSKEDSLQYKFKKFWIRRSLRIFPLYLAYVFLFGCTYLLFNFPDYYSACFPYLITYTYNYSYSIPWNPLFTHLWSLSVEEQFYLLFPFIIFLCKPRFIKVLMIAIIVCSPLIRYGLGEYFRSKGLSSESISGFVYCNTLSHLDAFCMGGIIPVLSLDRKILKPYLVLIASLFITLIAGLFNFLTTNSGGLYFNDLGYSASAIDNYQHVWHYLCLNLLFASFILTLLSVNSQHKLLFIRKILESSWMIRIGKVSYGMYVLHFGILMFLFDPFIKGKGHLVGVLAFIPYLITVYVAAELSYRFLELYFIKLKDKVFPVGGYESNRLLNPEVKGD